MRSSNAPTTPSTLLRLDPTAVQRRTMRVLVAAQLLAALGGSGAAAGALLALDVTGSEALVGLPPALLVAGSAATVAPISALSRRAGRRAGLSVALALAAVGAAGVVVAGAVSSFVLLCGASVLFGAGNTAVMLARYAAADLAVARRRGRDIGTVVFAATLGGVAGPNLLGPAGHAAAALGLPDLTGLYLFAVVAFALAAVTLFVMLRPDPLQLAVALDRAGHRHEAPRRLRHLLASPGAATGLLVVVVANFVMVAVMVMVPVHLHEHGHGLDAVGLVISLHVGAMFAPSPVTGRLVDRFGPAAVAGLGAALLFAAGVIAAASGRSPTLLAIGLVLLGVGWNAGLVAGTSLVGAAVRAAERPRIESVAELSMGAAAAIATGAAGPVVALAGYATLALGAAAGAVALAAVLLVRPGRRTGTSHFRPWRTRSETGARAKAGAKA